MTRLAGPRVGVALSGGGAWGFAHAALLHGLAARGIPVDIVAGASFGSLVGAFYAARGRDGLEVLVDRAPHIARTVRWCAISSAPIERFVQRELGSCRLEELAQAFLPVAADLTAARPVVLSRGPLAAAVRASCAFPGLWGPVISERARLVDGCIVSNVPVDALVAAGAELTIASCVMRPPSPRPAAQPRSRFARWWAPLSPARRVDDLRRAVRLLAFTASRREAAAADLCFAPELSPFRIDDFALARQIIARAAAQLGPLLDQVSARHAALSAARRVG